MSLIESDPHEQTKNVYAIHLFPSYNNDIKLHDVAMLEVIGYSFKMNKSVTNAFDSWDQALISMLRLAT